MVFDRSGEVRPGIEESWNSCVVFCEYLDDCWLTKDSWGGLMTESFNGLGTGITGDYNSFLFELLSLILKHRLSRGVLCEELYNCWGTEDSWCVLMTELFNGRVTSITSDDNSLIFEWLSFRLKQWLSWVVVCFLPWFFPVPLLWQLPITFGRGIMNAIWFFCGVVCLLFCLFMAIKRWEPTFWIDNCSHVWVSVPEIKLITIFFLNIILVRL